MPAEHAAKVGGDIVFENWTTLVATLANLFCDGDIDATSALLFIKFDDGRFGAKPG